MLNLAAGSFPLESSPFPLPNDSNVLSYLDQIMVLIKKSVQGALEIALSANCLLRKQKNLSLDPSAHVKTGLSSLYV